MLREVDYEDCETATELLRGLGLNLPGGRDEIRHHVRAQDLALSTFNVHRVLVRLLGAVALLHCPRGVAPVIWVEQSAEAEVIFL